LPSLSRIVHLNLFEPHYSSLIPWFLGCAGLVPARCPVKKLDSAASSGLTAHPVRNLLDFIDAQPGKYQPGFYPMLGPIDIEYVHVAKLSTAFSLD